VATVWTRHGARNLGLEVSTGITVNKKGWVLANAYDAQERPYSFVWNPVTDARVLLESTTDNGVLLGDLNDRGTVVGQIGTHAAIWHLRNQDMAKRHTDD
jgi:hypothetical protein